MNAMLFLTAAIIVSGIGCSSPATPPAELYNQEASLNTAGTLTLNPLQWQAITAGVNRKNKTMSTLYGNDRAFDHATHNADKQYPQGAVLALVTWQQQADAHWFGANIPGKVIRMETVTFDAAGTAYQLYEGALLKPADMVTDTFQAQQINRILNMKAVVFP